MRKSKVFQLLAIILMLTGCHGTRPDQNSQIAEKNIAEDGGDGDTKGAVGKSLPRHCRMHMNWDEV